MRDDETGEEVEELGDEKEVMKGDSGEGKRMEYFGREGFWMVGGKKFGG